jgi:hypothetical protein
LEALAKAWRVGVACGPTSRLLWQQVSNNVDRIGLIVTMCPAPGHNGMEALFDPAGSFRFLELSISVEF